VWEDPIVAEVRRVRKQIAAKFNNDIHAYFDHLREQEGLRLAKRERSAAKNTKK